jgi:RNA polymerase sigma-70 factor (ECF subfamily)
MAMKPDEVIQVLLRERLRIAAVAALILRDVHAADDIFQQIVLTALEGRGEFFEADHVLAWALRVARHRAIDLVRRAQLRPLPDDVLDQFEAEWGDPAPHGWSDQLEALHHCVGRLAGSARQLLRMKYSEGLTANVIAAKLHRSPDGVYQALCRIHRSLRECVARRLGQVQHVSGEAAT